MFSARARKGPCGKRPFCVGRERAKSGVPSPRVTVVPICNFWSADDASSACESVLMAQNSTPCTNQGTQDTSHPVVLKTAPQLVVAKWRWVQYKEPLWPSPRHDSKHQRVSTSSGNNANTDAAPTGNPNTVP